MNQVLSYRDLLPEKNYLKLFFANIISRFGDSIDAIAYGWMVYELTKSPTWLAIIFGVNALPSILFQPICGVLVERMNKKRLMVLTDLGRALTVFLTATLLWLGYLNPWHLILFTFINSSLESFRIPAGMAVYPQLIPKEKYAFAQGLSGSVSNIIQLIGTASAGIFIALIGVPGVIFIDALTFFISGIILMFLNITHTPSTEHKLTYSSFFIDFKEGFGYLREKHIVFLICLLAALINMFIVPFNTLTAAYVSDHLKLDANGLSLMMASLMLGLACGSYILPFILRKCSRFKAFIVSGITYSIMYLLMYFIPMIEVKFLVIASIFVTMFIFGMGAALMTGLVQIAFMEHVETKYLARTASIMNSFAASLMPIASFALGGIVTFMSIPTLFLVVGSICTLFYIACSFNKTLKQL